MQIHFDKNKLLTFCNITSFRAVQRWCCAPARQKGSNFIFKPLHILSILNWEKFIGKLRMADAHRVLQAWGWCQMGIDSSIECAMSKVQYNAENELAMVWCLLGTLCFWCCGFEIEFASHPTRWEVEIVGVYCQPL